MESAVSRPGVGAWLDLQPSTATAEVKDFQPLGISILYSTSSLITVTTARGVCAYGRYADLDKRPEVGSSLLWCPAHVSLALVDKRCPYANQCLNHDVDFASHVSRADAACSRSRMMLTQVTPRHGPKIRMPANRRAPSHVSGIVAGRERSPQM